MDKLDLLEKLLANNNLSKSEVRVCYFCYKQERTSKDVGIYLKWQAPNVARLLLTMYNKGFLIRQFGEDNKTYLYQTNISNDMLNIK